MSSPEAVWMCLCRGGAVGVGGGGLGDVPPVHWRGVPVFSAASTCPGEV